jgi:hypothetical protein
MDTAFQNLYKNQNPAWTMLKLKGTTHKLPEKWNLSNQILFIYLLINLSTWSDLDYDKIEYFKNDL